MSLMPFKSGTPPIPGGIPLGFYGWPFLMKNTYGPRLTPIPILGYLIFSKFGTSAYSVAPFAPGNPIYMTYTKPLPVLNTVDLALMLLSPGAL
jgi:hypothetical protein